MHSIECSYWRIAGEIRPNCLRSILLGILTGFILRPLYIKYCIHFSHTDVSPQWPPSILPFPSLQAQYPDPKLKPFPLLSLQLWSLACWLNRQSWVAHFAIEKCTFRDLGLRLQLKFAVTSNQNGHKCATVGT